MSLTTTWRAWSCLVRVTLGSGDGADLVSATDVVQRLMYDVARSVSRFRADSDLSRVNDRAGALIPVGPLTVQLVEVALDAARRTDGIVDPTVGAHLIGAGYADDIDAVRLRPRATATVPRLAADWTHVAVHRDLNLIGVPVGMCLDLGATAKAWTADEAARRVHARLGHAVLVEIGGDLAVAGRPLRPWRVDVAEVPGGTAYRVDLTHGGLATSSVLARSWTSDRGHEHHVIDPRTSRPADGPVRTATVWAPSAVAANTWSTAAIVWGDAAPARLRAAGLDARLVDTDGRVTALGAWPADEAVAA
jgi:thiamine biosynthesis lipoprotein